MNLSLLAKKMIFVILVLSLVLIAGGVAFYRSLSALPFALGVVLSAALNILKVVMLERTVQKVVGLQDEQTGKNIVGFHLLLRFLLTAAVLLVAALTPFINLLGAAAGVLTLHIAVFCMKFMKFDETV